MASQQLTTSLPSGFLSLAPETSLPVAASTSSAASSPSLAPVDSSGSLATSVKSTRSPSTDSTSSTSSAARRFLRLGHTQPEDAVVKGDFVEVEEL
ncbi:hypothetical protein KVT40_008883 [Elsinoe batatas]|uniref:Uncharacterized protein n=1 Tax=Elsinoe batatas TaxID=2601811 RepID=A0A8K0KUT5_9PEZI|nr:hypothetical protein KVT40_008883 [Elsinoe batatas]